MLFLVTGLPGEGKTLHTIQRVEKLRQESGRQVFYHGIPELKLPWQSFDDPQKWHELPRGAIIVMDESQRTFPPRGVGSEVPHHVKQFETHRHQGFDIFLLTQHPMLLDTAVRRLVGEHVHLSRIFGMERSNCYQWHGVRTTPEKEFDQKEAKQSTFVFPRELYQVYESADAHTHKANVPWLKFAVIAGGLLAVGLLFSVGYRLVFRPAPIAPASEASEQGRASDRPSRSSPALKLEDFKPEHYGFPFTASAYSRVVHVKSFPKPTGCLLIESGSTILKCRCTSQQSTLIEMTMAQCVNIVRNGYFDFSKPDVQERSTRSRPAPASSGAPTMASVTSDG